MFFFINFHEFRLKSDETETAFAQNFAVHTIIFPKTHNLRLQPRLTLSTIKLIVKNNTIHTIVDMKPLQTSGSNSDQPLVIIARSDVVANVSGKNVEMYLRTVGIPVKKMIYANYFNQTIPLTFDRPNNATQKQRGIKASERQLDCVPLQFANGRNDETETHAAQSLEDREDDDDEDVALAFHFEDEDHEDQHQGGLAAHHHELGYYVREKDFSR